MNKLSIVLVAVAVLATALWATTQPRTDVEEFSERQVAFLKSIRERSVELLTSKSGKQFYLITKKDLEPKIVEDPPEWADNPVTLTEAEERYFHSLGTVSNPLLPFTWNRQGSFATAYFFFCVFGILAGIAAQVPNILQKPSDIFTALLAVGGVSMALATILQGMDTSPFWSAFVFFAGGMFAPMTVLAYILGGILIARARSRQRDADPNLAE